MSNARRAADERATGGDQVAGTAFAELAELGTATVHEASGRRGVIDIPLIQVIPGTAAAGPARTVMCGQDDNLMVHAAMPRVQPGDVLVITMPEPAPIGVVGELLAIQARERGAAAMLVDAAIRDVTELVGLGLPIWSRHVRVRGAEKTAVGALDEPVEVGGAVIHPGDAVVLDADGAVVVARADIEATVQAGRARLAKEADKRAKLEAGALSYELDGLRDRFEA